MKIVYFHLLTLWVTIFPTELMSHYINLRKPVQDKKSNTLDQDLRQIMDAEKTQKTMALAVQEIMDAEKTQKLIDEKAAKLAKNIQKEIINLQQRIDHFQKIHNDLTVAEKQELMNLRTALREQQRDASGDISADPKSPLEYDQEPTIVSSDTNTDATTSKQT